MARMHGRAEPENPAKAYIKEHLKIAIVEESTFRYHLGDGRVPVNVRKVVLKLDDEVISEAELDEFDADQG